MGVLYSPKIVTDGLVLALDAANDKSFRGEPTENKINPNGFSSDSNFTVEKLAEYTFKVTLNSMPGSNGYYIGQSHTSLANTSTTMSVEVLETSNPSWVVGISGWGNITSGDSYVDGFRYVRTITHTVNWSYSISLGYVSSTFRSNVNVGDYIIARFAQIEEKPYATPFVNGTRGTTVATGGGWADRSGNGNHGELINNPTFDNDNLGSLVFDGVNDTVNFNYDLRSNWTYECWVLHNVVNGFSFLGQGPASLRSGLHIWFRSATNLRFGMHSNDTDTSSITTLTGVWYHYCFTYNHNTFLKQIYRNGVQLTGTPVQTQTSYIGTGTVRIGATYSSGGAYANGKISNAKLYNKVLTPQEILQNYNATKSRFGL